MLPDTRTDVFTDYHYAITALLSTSPRNKKTFLIENIKGVASSKPARFPSSKATENNKTKSTNSAKSFEIDKMSQKSNTSYEFGEQKSGKSDAAPQGVLPYERQRESLHVFFLLKRQKTIKQKQSSKVD